MKNKKFPKIVIVIAFVILALLLLFILVGTIITLREDKKIADYYISQQKILNEALETLDATKCSEYIQYPLGCVVMIAKRTSLDTCGNLSENYLVLACKSAASNNLTFCDSLNKYEKWTCEELAQSAINHLENDY